jgi:hypothetical protein
MHSQNLERVDCDRRQSVTSLAVTGEIELIELFAKSAMGNEIF